MRSLTLRTLLISIGWLPLATPFVHAAEVSYTHPRVSIVAANESLESVLDTLGKAMDITVRIPEGVNPVINCDIQEQTIPRALKNLLGELSYSLTWQAGGGRLKGLSVLSNGGEYGVGDRGGQASAIAMHTPQGNTVLPEHSPTASAHAASVASAEPDLDLPSSVDHRAEMEQERLAMEEERVAHEAQMQQSREKRKIEQQARDVETRTRHKAETDAYLVSIGIDPRVQPLIR